jgi:hypothetical protein
MSDRVREITNRNRGQSIGHIVAAFRNYLTDWKGYYRLADTPRTFRDLDEWIRHRLRALPSHNGNEVRQSSGSSVPEECHTTPPLGLLPMVAGGGTTPPCPSTVRYRIPTLTSSSFLDWLDNQSLSEPPDADPHAGWCGRSRRGITDAPMPILFLLIVLRQEEVVFDNDPPLSLFKSRSCAKVQTP